MTRLEGKAPQDRVANIEIKEVEETVPRTGTKRPKNIPSTREMIETLLAEAESAGKASLDTKELALKMQRRWWPGMGWNSFLPSASQLVKTGALIKNGKAYRRAVKAKGPDASAPEPNRSPNGGDGTPLFHRP